MKISRREFFGISFTGMAGAAILPGLLNDAFASRALIGLQLYTLRDELKKDLNGTLKKVAEIGYRNLELADYKDGKFYGIDPAGFRKITDSLDLKIISSHIDLGDGKQLTDKISRIADDHSIAGAKYCVQPSVPEKNRRTLDGYRESAEMFNKAGSLLKDRGIKFAYHNHNFEFGTLEGKTPYFDVLLENTSEELVKMELDLYWAIKAGQEPVNIFKKYPGRFELIHIKDMYGRQNPVFKTSEASDFAPVGSGIIDFRTILKAADNAGSQYLFVEQDSTKDGNPVGAVETSYRNLKKIL